VQARVKMVAGRGVSLILPHMERGGRAGWWVLCRLEEVGFLGMVILLGAARYMLTEEWRKGRVVLMEHGGEWWAREEKEGRS